MIPTRLVVVEGIIGSGKSTAARFIAEYLRQSHIDVRLVVEGGRDHPVRLANSLPHPFQPWRDVTPDEFIAQSYRKWRTFVAQIEATNVVTLCDGQLFHGNLTDLLMMDVEPQQLESYVAKVVQLISALTPVVIYFHQRDIADSLRATCQQRGRHWVDYQVDWKLQSPYARRRMLTREQGLFEFYQTYREICDKLLSILPIPQLHIDNTDSDWKAHYQSIIRFLQLPANIEAMNGIKKQLIEQLTAHRTWASCLATSYPLDVLLAPGACGDWSVKDTVAHVTAWNHRILSAAMLATRGGKPDALIHHGEDWPTAVTRLNKKTFVDNRTVSWAAVVADYSESVNRMIEFVTTRSERDLSPVSAYRPGRTSIGELIHVHVCRHTSEHRQKLETWLRSGVQHE